MQLDHERLDVDRLALMFIVVANDVAQALPPGRSYLAEQLQRAATSVVLNLPREPASTARMTRRASTA